jgi:hypothetical protein
MSRGLARHRSLADACFKEPAACQNAWRIVERDCSRHYTIIVYISTKLLLIGIIKNYNRGRFILAVISFAPASINIVSRGLPICVEQSSRLSEKVAKRGNNNCARPRTCRNRLKGSIERIELCFDGGGGPALDSFSQRIV